jgi:hypothetical protein
MVHKSRMARAMPLGRSFCTHAVAALPPPRLGCESGRSRPKTNSTVRKWRGGNNSVTLRRLLTLGAHHRITQTGITQTWNYTSGILHRRGVNTYGRRQALRMRLVWFAEGRKRCPTPFSKGGWFGAQSRRGARTAATHCCVPCRDRFVSTFTETPGTGPNPSARNAG